MDDLWQQFHRLPKAIRDAVATKQALAAVERLEEANPGLDLADFVMRLMVKEFPVADLPSKLETEAKLSPDKSKAVTEQLKSGVLAGVAEYLGFQPPSASPPAPTSKPPAAVATPTNVPSGKTSLPPTPQPAAPKTPSAPPVPAAPQPITPPVPMQTAPAAAGVAPRKFPWEKQSPDTSVEPTPLKTPAPLGSPSSVISPPPLGQPREPFKAPSLKPSGTSLTAQPELGKLNPASPGQSKPFTPLGQAPTPETQPLTKPITPAKPITQPTPTPPPLTSTEKPPLGRPSPEDLSSNVPGKPPVPVPLDPLPLPVMAAPSRPIGAIAPTQEYSEEETAEIERQAERVKKLQPGGPADFDDLAKGVLDLHHLAWPDELMTRRALAISKARLKEIRNSEQTEAVLIREPKIGGLGLDPDLAKQLTLSLEKEAGRLKAQGMVRPPAPPEALPPVVAPPVQPSRPAGQPPLVKAIPPTGLPPGPAPANVTETPRPSRPIKRPADIPAPVTPRPAPTPPPVMQRPRQPDRPTVSDITRPPKAYGPGEEIKSLTLTEWRRLGQGAAESARALLEKFKHLQHESFALWTAALTGWRQSEVYQLYLDMGRQSLDSGITIQEVIAARARAGQTYLSEHEFYTITDLNRMLQH